MGEDVHVPPYQQPKEKHRLFVCVVNEGQWGFDCEWHVGCHFKVKLECELSFQGEARVILRRGDCLH